MMLRKGAKVIYSAMWYPRELFYDDGEYITKEYRLKIEGDKAYMSFGSTELAYVHKLKDWRRNVAGAQIKWCGYTIINETKFRIGSMHINELVLVRGTGEIS